MSTQAESTPGRRPGKRRHARATRILVTGASLAGTGAMVASMGSAAAAGAVGDPATSPAAAAGSSQTAAAPSTPPVVVIIRRVPGTDRWTTSRSSGAVAVPAPATRSDSTPTTRSRGS